MGLAELGLVNDNSAMMLLLGSGPSGRVNIKLLNVISTVVD